MKRILRPKPASVLEWESRHRYCFLCLTDARKSQRGGGLVTHHINRRGTSYRPFRDNPDNLMRLCWLKCHAEVEGWPAAPQLALKWVHDKAGHKHLRDVIAAWL